MEKYNLDSSWEFVEAGIQNPMMVNMLTGWQKTNLPHDYGMEKPRRKDVPNGQDEGFTDSAGLYYKKVFVVDESATDKQFWLEFEGVAGVTEVRINNAFAVKHMNPYTSFWVDVSSLVRPGENTILVHTDNRMKPNSRWYVGTGIYRHVWMYVGEKSAVKPHSIQITTNSLDADSATIDVQADILGAKSAYLTYTVVDAVGAVLATQETECAASDEVRACTKMALKGITPWSPEHPVLYTLRVEVKANGKSDITEERFGLRRIEVNSKEGFILNGKPMKLKGGCIHHDLGLLGAASYDAAERGRIKTLMDSGYNALRLSHNPYAPNIFAICDELGMLVVEEAFDEWVLARTSFGLHITFEQCWEKDLEDMVNRDYNHPSIIMWSTGNEVEERDGSADGYAWSKRLADKVRSLDATRPVSATACSLFVEYTQRPNLSEDEMKGTTGNQALNMAYDNFASGVDLWGDATAPFFAPLDVAGYNYKSVRYAHDAQKFPDRVIYGSETYPRAAFQSWKSTMENDNVIGDFVWTAWDYLGEVGIGRYEVSDNMRPATPEWPWLLAHCSDINVIGEKRPQSHYRDYVWNHKTAPMIFVLPPNLTGEKIVRMSWTWLPVERNYTFPDHEGKPIEVNVYANADEVELLQNGTSMGKKPCSETEEYIAVFEIPYLAGTLEAVSYIGGKESGRDKIHTTGKTQKLVISADHDTLCADGKDLLFVTIHAHDETGNRVFIEKGEVELRVKGGKLLAFGNADPKPDELVPYRNHTCALFEGAALAIICSDSTDECCEITAHMDDCESITLSVSLRKFPASDTLNLIRDPMPSATDLSLGELLSNRKAVAVLKQYMGDLLGNPTLEQMKGIPLKKMLSLGGQQLPLEMAKALDNAMAEQSTM